MRFDFTVHADNATELHDAVRAMLDALPGNLFSNPARQFSISVLPDYHGTSALTQPIHIPRTATANENGEAQPEVTDTPAPAPDSKPKRGRPAKTAEAVATIMATDAPQPDVSEARPEVTEAVIPAAEAAPTAETKPGITPAEAKLKAMDILRDCFAQPEGPATVRGVSEAMGVKKFSEVPDEQGHVLLERAYVALSSLAPAQAA